MQFCTKVVHGKLWRLGKWPVLLWRCKLEFFSIKRWCRNPCPIIMQAKAYLAYSNYITFVNKTVYLGEYLHCITGLPLCLNTQHIQVRQWSRLSAPGSVSKLIIHCDLADWSFLNQCWKWQKSITLACKKPTEEVNTFKYLTATGDIWAQPFM